LASKKKRQFNADVRWHFTHAADENNQGRDAADSVEMLPEGKRGDKKKGTGPTL